MHQTHSHSCTIHYLTFIFLHTHTHTQQEVKALQLLELSGEVRALLQQELSQGGELGALLRQEVKALLLSELSGGGEVRALLQQELLQGGELGALLRQEVKALLLSELSGGGEVRALLQQDLSHRRELGVIHDSSFLLNLFCFQECTQNSCKSFFSLHFSSQNTQPIQTATEPGHEVSVSVLFVKTDQYLLLAMR